jgi:hypothetical protein
MTFSFLSRKAPQGVRVAPQGVRVAPQRVVDALAVGQAVGRGVLVPPGPEGADACAVEVPGADLIEAGFD